MSEQQPADATDFQGQREAPSSVLMTKSICVETGFWLLRNSLAYGCLFRTLLEAIISACF